MKFREIRKAFNVKIKYIEIRYELESNYNSNKYDVYEHIDFKTGKSEYGGLRYKNKVNNCLDNLRPISISGNELKMIIGFLFRLKILLVRIFRMKSNKYLKIVKNVRKDSYEQKKKE